MDFLLWGKETSDISVILSRWMWIPSLDVLNPRSFPSPKENKYFLEFREIPYLWQHSKICFKYFKWLLHFFHLNQLSLIYSPNLWNLCPWLSEMLHHHWLTQMVYFDKNRFPIWFKMWSLTNHLDVQEFDYNLKIHPRKDISSEHATNCSISSIGGNGKLSFWQALLRLRKSIHIRISPFFFLIGTRLETHLECLTRKIILALRSLFNSHLI